MNPETGRTPNSRAAAAAIVEDWLVSGRFPDRLIPPDAPDRPFLVEVIYGCVKQRRLMEWVLRRCSRRGTDPRALPYLLVGLYQVLFMDRVPAFAAVSETVAAVKQGPARSAAAYVNAVLRRAVREQGQIDGELARQRLGVRESHPDELVDRWRRGYGPQATLRLCRWNNRRGRSILRVNPRRTDAATLRARLREARVPCVPHRFGAGRYLVLGRGSRVASLPGYEQGCFTVQDPSTELAVDLLAPRPGESVLDACAAPGGKTVLIAERMQGRGSILALDRHADRLTRLHENCRRLDLGIVDPARADASSPAAIRQCAGERRFARVLVDAPCTNTGVLRRRPDARWRFSAQRMATLAATQRRLLDAAASFLEPAGRLVYSTCSLEPEEGQELVRGWLDGHPGFTLVEQRTLFPPDSNTDGVYAAALTRNT